MPAQAQITLPIGRVSALWHDAGIELVANRSTDGVPYIADAQLIVAPRAAVTRLRFESWHLPDGVAIRLTGLASNASCVMTAAALKNWSGHSPLFAGDSILVEMLCSPPHEAASVRIQGVASLTDDDAEAQVHFTRGICGPDDRVRDSHGPVARLWNGVGVCTASLIMTGEHMLSAGHCGPLGIDALVEFDPPDSTENGQRVPAPPDRQFPYVNGSELRDFDFVQVPCPTPDNPGRMCIASFGDDGMIFRVGPNINGHSAGQARGTFMRIAAYSLPFSETPGDVRKWGCGVMQPEADPFSRTLKRIDGECDNAEDLDDGAFYIYDIDQTGGDSGGPLVAADVNAAVGVVSFGNDASCEGAGAYSFSDFNFKALINQAVASESTRFVDGVGTPNSSYVEGSIWNPAVMFRRGYDTVQVNGRVVVAPGTFQTGDGVLSRPATIVAPLGPVTLTR